ncbi:MAG: DUF6371 domain-containing protein [Flavobacteriaceae bacterium]|nr:DUF6371 domain-containing protein [Flavobacteriaceae bacterium]
MKLDKIKLDLKFKPKRNYKLITPCCNRSNRDGKYINYMGMDDQYGYCHSCGKVSLPKQEYLDKNGEKYVWNENLGTFEKVFDTGMVNQSKTEYKPVTPSKKIELKYINPSLVKESFIQQPENNLLAYIRKTYGDEKTERVINLYYLGTDATGYTLFWSVDKDLMVRKAKAIKYDSSGKRTSKIRSPYLNEHGFKTCLFGEHLLKFGNSDKDIYVLVESEKTAIISSIILPEYWWLAYGGINGLTSDKMKVLKGFRVLIIPDMSENAVSIIRKKLKVMEQLGIHAKIWDMTNGRTDKQLKQDLDYNNDLEDLLKKQSNYEN